MPPRRHKRRRGYSLLELVMAVALVGGTLVPAMALMRDGMELSRTTDERQLLATYAVLKLEEKLPEVASGWTSPITAFQGGSLSSEGYPSMRFLVTWSDSVSEGGLVDELIHVVSTVYVDEDGDFTLDDNEPRSVFRTKISRLLTYATRASS